MLHNTINLTEDGRVTLVTYIHNNYTSAFENFQPQKRPAIIVLPGGAYGFLSGREAEPVALTFLKEGFSTFILNYSIGENSAFPNPLNDVSRAIWTIRENADEWNIDTNAIVLMGFSAGAGVAAMAATQWNTPDIAKSLGIPEGGNKPNAVVLGYGAAMNSTVLDDPDCEKPFFLGKIAKDRSPQLEFLNYMGIHVPPMFIWHVLRDKYVPAVNQLMFAQAMQKYNLPYELHIFQNGRHGMSVSNDLSAYKDKNYQNNSVSMWVPLCTNWLRNLFEF